MFCEQVEFVRGTVGASTKLPIVWPHIPNMGIVAHSSKNYLNMMLVFI